MNTERSDQELLDGVREKDNAALRELFQRYYPRVFAFVQRRLGDGALSEETVADTFFEVWRNADGFRGESRISTWIFGIATFKSLEADRNRRRLKRASVIPTNIETLHRARDPRDSHKTLEARDQLRWVKRRLDALPPAQQDVVRMALVEGRDTDEIAEALGISRGTVKSRLSRARRELRSRADQARLEG